MGTDWKIKRGEDYIPSYITKYYKNIKPVLPGISDFFDCNATKTIQLDNNQDSDDEPDVEVKRKRLTLQERSQKANEEENRLRKIEEELADPNQLPQSAEQFDRLLLGQPDNSEMWTRYIAFHVQATEFDKARTVAVRALDRIAYNLTQDRLNLWIAYMNLENMYGTKETFDKVFNDAVRSNDALTVYVEAIKMLSGMNKFAEMDEKIKKMRGKFKQEPLMWLEIAKIYYSLNRFADARKLKDAALLTLIDKKTHVNLIVQFAIMESNYGDEEQSKAIFDTLLEADPKRVDIWCTYVDQLIKKNQITNARDVLKRAVGQKLQYRKMRTLFKKYYAFEQKHGNDKNVEHVKKLLEGYSG